MNRTLSPRSFPNNAALARYRRIVITSGYAAYASANERALAVTEKPSQSTDSVVAGQLAADGRTRILTSSEAISQYARVYAAANGKVAATGSIYEGIALTSTSGDGEELEVAWMPDPHEKLYVATAASSAISNTTTETLFDSNFTIPANTLKAGDVIKIRYQGIATATNSTDTLAIKLYIGGLTGTALISHAATDVANNDVFSGEMTLVVRDIGATGHIVGMGTYKSVPAAEGTITVKDKVLASTAIDTTAAQQIGVSATWSVANSGNSVRLDILNVERLAA
jgi:hypothetical protein